MSIQASSLATTTLSSSDVHQKQRSQFLSSIASAHIAPAVLESFDETYVMPSSVKFSGTVSGISPYSSKAANMQFNIGGTCVSGYFSRRTSTNRLPGLCALVIQEETPSLLPVGFLKDILPQLTRKHHVVIASGYRLIFLLSSAGGSALPGSTFRLEVS